jgi:hypothetical protein
MPQRNGVFVMHKHKKKIILFTFLHHQGNSAQARAVATNLSQKLNQIRNKIQDALVTQVADDFIDIGTPLKQMADVAVAPLGRTDC